MTPRDRNSAKTRVDFHTHIVPELPDHAVRLNDPRWPQLVISDGVGELIRDGRTVRKLESTAWSLSDRVEAMDAAGIDHHVLSPLPPLICDWGTADEAGAWAKALNTSIAEMSHSRPDRFSGLGTVPLHFPDQAVCGLQHAHEIGLAGVEIGTDAGGRELDDPALRPFFAAAERLEMILFVHPLIMGSQSSWTNRIQGPEVAFGLGMGTDTAIAASRLVFGGVTEQFPNLKICLAHGGGAFVWMLARIAKLWDRSGDFDRPTVGELTRNIFVDSVVYDRDHIAFLAESVGGGRLLFGTDYPLPAQDDLRGRSLDVLDAADRDRVWGLNALELLSTSPSSLGINIGQPR